MFDGEMQIMVFQMGGGGGCKVLPLLAHRIRYKSKLQDQAGFAGIV